MQVHAGTLTYPRYISIYVYSTSVAPRQLIHTIIAAMDSDGRAPPKLDIMMSEVVLVMPPDDDTKRSLSPSTNPGSHSVAKASKSLPKQLPGDDGPDGGHFRFEQARPVIRTNFGNSSSPDHSMPHTPPVAHWPPRPPPPPDQAVTRRRSLARSVYSKPKSRLVEQRYPASAYHAVLEGSDTATAGNRSPPRTPAVRTDPTGQVTAPPTPKTPYAAADEEEEELIREYVPPRKKWRKKLKFWSILEWLALISGTVLLVASLTVRRLQGCMISGLEMWKWCLLVMVIICGRLVTARLITILVFIMEMNFMLQKKVLYFVYGIRRSVQVCLWSGLVLLTWGLMFDRSADRSERTKKFLIYFSRTMGTVLIGSFLWLVKTLLVKLLASSFHVKTFFDRIQESIFHQYILQTLSGPPLMEMAETIGKNSPASSRSTVQLSFRNAKGGIEKDEKAVIDVARLQKAKPEKVSALTMKKLVQTITSSGLWTITKTLDQHACEDDGNEQQDKEITSELEAKMVASEIFKNVAKPGSKYIDEEDLLRFLSKEELEIVLAQFEGAVETRKIKKSAMRNWVVGVYVERKSLSHSLSDTKTAVRQLDKLASVAVIILVLLIWVLVMQFATSKVLLFVASQLLLAGFIFKNTCQTIFEAIIFVFVTHPLDVGDRCIIDGVQMVVEEANILTTVFLRYDNEKIYYPNAVLATKPISNLHRSPDMGDSVEFSVDLRTPVDTLKAFKERVKRYIEGKPHHWRFNHSIVVKDIHNMNSMKLALTVSHTMNFQDVGEKNNRRTNLLIELKKIFEDLGMAYHLLPQEVRLVGEMSDRPPVNFGQ